MPPDNPSTSSGQGLSILSVSNKKEFKEFLNLPYRLYRDDPHWIPPLKMERAELLNTKKKPYYLHAEVKLFLARRGSRTVGRISAQVDREYEKFHGERLGQFGFFECENDPEAARALLEAAQAFHRERGAVKSQGPFSFSINEESGLMIEGFEAPLMTLMPYNPRFYAGLIEGAGFRKLKDLFAWRYSIGEVPKDAAEVAELVAKTPGLVIRKIYPKNLKEDLKKVMEIFNSAWSENWGFVPLTPEEVAKVGKDLKPILVPETALLAELDGQPAAMCIGIPNIYEIIHDLKGRLSPFGLFNLLYRLKRHTYKSGRLMLLGDKKEHRNTILGGLSILLYAEINKASTAMNAEWGELSWTLEDNKKINSGIEFMGGKRYKIYRVYEKAV